MGTILGRITSSATAAPGAASSSSAAPPSPSEKSRDNSASSLLNNNTKMMMRVVVQLQRHDEHGIKNDVEALKQKRVEVTISISSDGSVTRGGGKYTMCSLLLQIGKLLGVQPSYAPSPRISSIFDKILEQWCLRNKNEGRNMKQISEIKDGDKLFLCCGDYSKECTGSVSSNEVEVELLDLIPKKHNIVHVSLVDASEAKAGEATGEANTGDNTNNDCSIGADSDSDSNSDIEDVTEMYQSQKARAPPEIIDLADSSSDDDDDGNESESCFWEYDKDGNMRRNHNSSLNRKANKTEAVNKSHNDADQSDSESDISREDSSIDSDSSSDIEDVTEIMMAKRKEQAQKMVDDAEEIDDDSDEECAKAEKERGKKRKKKAANSQSTAKRRKKKITESPIQVVMEEKDIPNCPGAKINPDGDGGCLGGSNNASENNDEEVDHSIKQRIVKLLNTGFHEESNEHEAKNAMKLARRLCQRYNLDQAVLLQQRGDGSLNDFSTTNDDETSALQGGIVTVKILRRKDSKPLSSFPRWHDYLVKPVCMNFQVEAFKTVVRSTPQRTGECSVTFYGIRTNAQLAAYAFKVASERIALMAATYEPPRTGTLPTRKQAAETRTARLSYALGIVNGLKRDVKEGLEKEEELRKINLRKAQSMAKSGEAYHEDSDGNSDGLGNHSTDGIDGCADSNELAGDMIPRHQSSPKEASANTAEQLNRLEKENTAHLALVDHHKKIASDVLKSKKIKVRSARNHKSISLNRKAYEKGVIDSKEIDLNQQTIE